MKKYELSLQVGLVRHSDIGKEITLRNANERRRLDGHLKDLDHQLHNKLVNMQAEIMELRSSPYGTGRKTSPRNLVESRERTYSDGGLRVSRSARDIRGEAYSSPTPSEREHEQERKAANTLALPEINLANTSLVCTPVKSVNNDASRFENKSRNKSREVSPRGQKFLQIPSSSFYRPSSLPDLRAAESRHRLSPRTTRRVLLQSPEPLDEKQSSTTTTQSSSPENNIDNRVTNFIARSEKTQKLSSEQGQEFHKVLPEITTENPSPNSDPKSENSDEIDSLFYNSILAKATYGDGDFEDAPDLTSMGFMDFNNVIDKRLKQSQEELPSEEDMRKIRYLRWNEKEKESDLVKEVFESRDSKDSP